MTAATPSLEKQHDQLDPMASRYVDVAGLPWVDTKYPGIKFKVLVEDKDTGLSTALFHWQPGARLPMHEHVGIEQSYILEGSLLDHDGEATAGNFVWRPAGSRHDVASPNGVLLLAMLLTPNDFFGEL